MKTLRPILVLAFTALGLFAFGQTISHLTQKSSGGTQAKLVPMLPEVRKPDSSARDPRTLVLDQSFYTGCAESTKNKWFKVSRIEGNKLNLQIELELEVHEDGRLFVTMNPEPGVTLLSYPPQEYVDTLWLDKNLSPIALTRGLRYKKQGFQKITYKDGEFTKEEK